MYLEKQDYCPDCKKLLSQEEYDLQRCDDCGTGMDFERRESAERQLPRGVGPATWDNQG